MKFDFRSESFKRKFSSNIFACNFIIGFPKSNREDFSLKRIFEQRNKETKIKIKPQASANRPLNIWAQVNKPSVTSVIFSQKFVIVRREEPRLQYYAITREIQVKVATKWTSVRSKIIHKILP